MRALLAAMVVAVPLSACAMPPAPRQGPTQYDATQLRARLYMPFGIGAASFHVNRPAHVAIFEVQPGQGVRMIYPRFGGEASTVTAGTHTVWRSTARFGMGGWDSGFRPVTNYGFGSGMRIEPRIFYLIASERPLRVAPYVGSSFALDAALGGFFHTSRAFSLTHDLARLVVPSYERGDWVADIHVEWPQPATEQAVPMHVVTCWNGQRFVVSVYMDPCPRGPQTTTEPGDSVAPRGDEQPQRPDRRRPEREDRGRIAEDAGARGAPDATAQPERVRRVRPQPTGDGEARPARAPREDARPARERPQPSREAPSNRSTDSGSSQSRPSPAPTAAPSSPAASPAAAASPSSGEARAVEPQ